MTKRSVKHATFVIERVYDAQPTRVFAALSDPAVKPLWFNGPEALGPDKYLIDFREGGVEVSPEMREHGTAEILDALGAYLDGRKTGRALATAVAGG